MIYKGELKGFPTEVVEKMLERQEEKGNPRDVTVFEKDACATRVKGGFLWEYSEEGFGFWNNIIRHRQFNVFFEKYPKTEKTLTFPRKMLVGDYAGGTKCTELVLGIFPERDNPYKVIGMYNAWRFAEEIAEEKPKDPLLEKLEKLETELQTLKNEIKSRTA